MYLCSIVLPAVNQRYNSKSDPSLQELFVASFLLVFILYQVERAGCEVLARLLGALDPVLVLERLSLQMSKQTLKAMLDPLG